MDGQVASLEGDLKKDPSECEVLVVGADSVIGGALLNAFGRRAIGTSRRKDSPHIKLDLSSKEDCFQKLPNVKTAFLCAGITSIQKCHEENEISKKINVTNTLLLSENLINNRSKIVFFSTSLVFDGEKQFPHEEDATNPICEYGMQKQQVENQIIKYGENSLIIRLSKIVTPSLPIFTKWAAELLDNNKIYPFTDYQMAPLSLESIVDLAEKLLQDWHSGVLHFSSDEAVSYAEAASILGDLLKIDLNNIIRKTSVDEKEKTGVGRLPKNVILSTKKLNSVLSFETPKGRKILTDCLVNIAKKFK
jgi:dTDP-4-dehydrorhamnose reductase